MKDEYWVLRILQAIVNHSVERPDFNKLIELTHSFAATYLKYRYKNLSHTLMGGDITLGEMALEVIAPLFERDSSGTFIRIEKSFIDWKPEIVSEEQAVFFINRLAAKSTEKYVSELLKASDPFFSKILHSVNYFVESRGYKKKQILGTTYILTDENIQPGLLPANQFIYDLPMHLFNKKNNIIEEIFNYIKVNSDYAAAIPLNALVIKIKKTGVFSLEQTSRQATDSTVEIESIIDNAVSDAFDKLELSYLKKNKIDKNESDAIKNALRKIAADLRDGGINIGLHNYLIDEIPALSFEDYRRNYQNIFEYLFKILKKKISEHLKDG